VGLLSGLHRPRRFAGVPDALDSFWYAPAGWSGAFSQTGIRVTPELAMTVSAVWFGMNFLARNLGSMPCGVLQHSATNAKLPALSNPLSPILGFAPNDTQDALEFFEQATGHLVLRGNFYAKIVSGLRGYVDQLLPMHPDLVRVGRLPNGRLQYTVRNVIGQPPDILTQDEVFHVRGYSTDGMTGLSMIAYGANSIGTAIAQDTYTARFFKQGASASIAVKHPGVLGEVGAKNLRQSISAYLNGLQNVGGVLVLEENASLDKIGISPQDAQLLGMKDHSIREVARWLGLPSYLFSDMGKPPTYASSAQFAEDLVRYSFRPLARRFEMAIRRQLIVEPDVYSAEFDMSELLKGDIQARSAFYHMAILDGWMNRNEVRIKENMNPEDGLDDFLEPQNMRDAGALQGQSTSAPTPAPPSDARRDVRATILAVEAAARVVRKELVTVRKKATELAKDPEGWSTWLLSFYADHARFVAETLHLPLPLAREYAARQGLRLRDGGVGITEDWEFTVPTELASWALDGERRTV
jgi:HK97 family phage portal protein